MCKGTSPAPAGEGTGQCVRILQNQAILAIPRAVPVVRPFLGLSLSYVSSTRPTHRATLQRLRPPAGRSGLLSCVAPGYREREGFEIRPFSHEGLEGLLVLGAVPQERAEWCTALSSLVGEEVGVPSLVPGAVLLVRTDTAVYALSYGTGRHMIDQTHLDTGFGMRFALRSLNARQVKLVRRHLMDSRGRTDEHSTARVGSLHDLNREWIGSVVSRLTGMAVDLPLTHARSTRRPTRVECTDTSLTLPLGYTPRLLLGDLRAIEEICARPGELPGLESVARIRSLRGKGRTALVQGLDRRLDALLGAPSSGRLALSVPDECAHLDDVLAVRCTLGSRVVRGGHVSLGKLLTLVRDRPAGRRLSALRQARVQLFADLTCGVELSAPLPAHRWLAAEVREGASYHFYWQGQWYVVGEEYLAALADDVRDLLSEPVCVSLPRWPVGKRYDERWFNEEIAKQDGYTLFDRRTVRTPTFRGGGLEICDVLGPRGELIMVKKADSGSAALSHLSAQSRVAVEALRYDVQVREKFLARVREFRDDLTADQILAAPTVVFAIRLKGGVPLTVESLFPFTQVALLQTAVALGGMGARVAIASVGA